MTEPFLGEIQVFGFSFAPREWASCNGAVVPIQQNMALFALLGTNYGGNGTTNFSCPILPTAPAATRAQAPGFQAASSVRRLAQAARR
ncbi:tail fiber protein [Mesorhizobium sp. WSM4306]|uniref:phage tail protein n=1 Tax=Mesorhizobium sp. WSM4306 TaxID=2589885 RepID=UPI001FEDB4CE|nr:tail fiber protein [Mesorhizobium sp. WSM4306]